MTNQTETSGGLPQGAAILFGVGLGIEAALAILGNMIVLWSFKRDADLRIPRFFYIFNLCLCDLIRGMIVVPIATIDLLSGERLPAAYCQYGIYLSYTLFSESVLSIILISCDRYLMVKNSFSYMRNETNQKTGVKIALSWLLSFAWNALTVFCWRYIEADSDGRSKGQRMCSADYEHSHYIYLFSIIEFVLPLVIIAALNVATYYMIARTKRLNGRTASERDTSTHSSLNLQSQGSMLVRSRTLLNNVRRTIRTSSLHSRNSLHSHHGKTAKECDNNLNEISEETQEIQPLNRDCQNGLQCDNRFSISDTPAVTRKIRNSIASQRSFSADFSKPKRSTVAESRAESDRRMLNLRKSGKTVNFSMRKVGKSLAILVGIYFVCWLPTVTCIIVSRACSNCVPMVWFVCSAFVAYLDPALNPIIYGLSHKRFAKNFRGILCFWKKE